MEDFVSKTSIFMELRSAKAVFEKFWEIIDWKTSTFMFKSHIQLTEMSELAFQKVGCAPSRNFKCTNTDVHCLAGAVSSTECYAAFSCI